MSSSEFTSFTKQMPSWWQYEKLCCKGFMLYAGKESGLYLCVKDSGILSCGNFSDAKDDMRHAKYKPLHMQDHLFFHHALRAFYQYASNELLLNYIKVSHLF